MGMGFAPTWLPQVSPPLLHKTTGEEPTTDGDANRDQFCLVVEYTV